MTQTRGSAGAPPPSAVLLQMSNVVVPRALYVAAKLGIADLIAERPKSAGNLAAATGTHAITSGGQRYPANADAECAVKSRPHGRQA